MQGIDQSRGKDVRPILGKQISSTPNVMLR
jgi:hypothetical protein